MYYPAANFGARAFRLLFGSPITSPEASRAATNFDGWCGQVAVVAPAPRSPRALQTGRVVARCWVMRPEPTGRRRRGSRWGRLRAARGRSRDADARRMLVR